MSELSLVTREFLGLDFTVIEPAAAEQLVLGYSAGQTFRYVVTPNVDHIVRLQAERRPDALAQLNAAYAGCSLQLCDSRILARLAKLSGMYLPVVTGSDLSVRLLSGSLPQNMRIAVIGGDDRQMAQLRALQPNVVWHLMVPPMGVRNNPEAQASIVRFVEETQAAIVLFAIGAPQSEIVAHQIWQRGKAPGVGLCIGASIEFLTGDKKRAPRILQALSLEWAFRLASEPRRLWRRYLVEGPAIFAIWRRWSKQRR
jgi:N-acetylglucosaminyldiphosphoundecaprenol N-acetyl-beta-D-mannosaminyltransferase